MKKVRTNKYLISRRVIQIGLLALFSAGNYLGWNVLRGNYSAALFLDTIPLADPYAVLQMLCTGFIAASDVLMGASLVLVLYALVFGRMFCSWVCPVNILSDTASKLNTRLKSERKPTISRHIRYGALAISLIVSAFVGVSAFEIISPIGMLHRALVFGVGGAWTVVLALFLFDVASVRFAWCGHLCPLGAFYSLVGHKALLKVKHSADNCTGCGNCFQVCPEVQVLHIVNKQNEFIRSSECTNCARCIEVCHDDALKFSVRNPLQKNNASHEL